VFVYGGTGINFNDLASVEMLSTDERVWQTLPTLMFHADSAFSSVPLS
jgi:hypothetical protein